MNDDNRGPNGLGFNDLELMYVFVLGLAVGATVTTIAFIPWPWSAIPLVIIIAITFGWLVPAFVAYLRRTYWRD